HLGDVHVAAHHRPEKALHQIGGQLLAGFLLVSQERGLELVRIDVEGALGRYAEGAGAIGSDSSADGSLVRRSAGASDCRRFGWAFFGASAAGVLEPPHASYCRASSIWPSILR